MYLSSGCQFVPPQVLKKFVGWCSEESPCHKSSSPILQSLESGGVLYSNMSVIHCVTIVKVRSNVRLVNLVENGPGYVLCNRVERTECLVYFFAYRVDVLVKP